MKEYYSIEPLIEYSKEHDTPFCSAIGGKGNGKTYSAFTYALKQKALTGRNCVYLRRLEKSLERSIIGTLISVHKQDIINIFKGKFNWCELIGKIFFLQRVETDSKGNRKVKYSEPFCYCRSLNTIEADTGADLGLISCVIYDEFLTRGKELKDEFYKLMVAHNNYCRNRTDFYIPFILLGNTVSRDSQTALNFGIELRKIDKRGITAIKNKKGQYRIVLEYCEQTTKQAEAEDTYYSRFQNEHINMITKGDFVIGQYPISPLYLYNVSDRYVYKFFYNNIAVNVRVKVLQGNCVILIDEPSEKFNILVSDKPSIHVMQLTIIPDIIIKAIMQNRYYVTSNDIGEAFRDIVKHMPNGNQILLKLE